MPLTRLDVLAGYPLLSSPAERVSLHPAPALVWGGRLFGSSDVLRAPKQGLPVRRRLDQHGDYFCNNQTVGLFVMSELEYWFIVH